MTDDYILQVRREKGQGHSEPIHKRKRKQQQRNPNEIHETKRHDIIPAETSLCLLPLLNLILHLLNHSQLRLMLLLLLVWCQPTTSAGLPSSRSCGSSHRLCLNCVRMLPVPRTSSLRRLHSLHRRPTGVHLLLLRRQFPLLLSKPKVVIRKVCIDHLKLGLVRSKALLLHELLLMLELLLCVCRCRRLCVLELQRVLSPLIHNLLMSSDLDIVLLRSRLPLDLRELLLLLLLQLVLELLLRPDLLSLHLRCPQRLLLHLRCSELLVLHLGRLKVMLLLLLRLHLLSLLLLRGRMGGRRPRRSLRSDPLCDSHHMRSLCHTRIASIRHGVRDTDSRGERELTGA